MPAALTLQRSHAGASPCQPCQAEPTLQSSMAPPRMPPTPPTPPQLTSQQRAHWRSQWAAESEDLERRRRELLAVAEPVAAELCAHWPEISIWLFGSTLGQAFHADSDLDLAVAGLPAEALIEALGVAEGCAMRVAERQGLAPIALVVVRHLYADHLDPQQVRQRLAGSLELWRL